MSGIEREQFLDYAVLSAVDNFSHQANLASFSGLSNSMDFDPTGNHCASNKILVITRE